MSGYYLILIIHGAALWGIPVPYADAPQCEAAGLIWKDSSRNSRGYYCLPAPIVTGDTVNRRSKGDGFPLMKCTVPDVNAGPDGTQVCGK